MMKTAFLQTTARRGGIAALLLAASLLALTGPGQAQPSPAAERPTEAIASVTVAYVTRADMVGQVSVSGTLVPREEILVYPQVNGSTLETLLVDIGDTVAAGDILATLDDSTLTAQLAQSQAEHARALASVSQARSQITSAEANATQAASTLQRVEALRENGTSTQAAVDQAVAAEQTARAGAAQAQDGLLVAQAQVQQAQAQLDIATLNLNRATLRAPADGLISARNGQVGAIATSGGEPIFRIIRDGLIEVEAEVIETALGDITLGDAAQLTIASIGDATGIVRRIAPTVDPRNRLGTIRIEMPGVTGLRSGLFASGRIVVEERNSLVVPPTAVLTDGQGTFVLAVIEGHLHRRAVQVGLIWEGQREVLSGLAEGDVVVARAGVFFGHGDTITPIFPATQGATE